MGSAVSVGGLSLCRVCRGFALLERQNCFCVASSGAGRQQRGGQGAHLKAKGQLPPPAALGLPTSLALWAGRCWPVLGATQRCSEGATATLASCPCALRGVPAPCAPSVPWGDPWIYGAQSRLNAQQLLP